MTSLILCILTVCVVSLLFALLSRKARRPPGPRRLPFFGNTLQLPRTCQWITFSKWAKQYGNIVYLQAFRQPIILLNSAKVARELLEQRSGMYSGRPHLKLKVALCRSSGFDKVFVLYSSNEEWRQQRRIVSHDLAPRMIPRYHALQESEARLLVRSIIDHPKEFERLIKLKIGTIIIRIIYGHNTTLANDPFFTFGKTSMDIFSSAAEPGVWLVDAMPILKFAPAWLPGTDFLVKARRWKEIVHKAAWDPYLWSKRSFECGTALLPNTCATVLEEMQGNMTPHLEEQIVWAACTMMAGGMDTSIISTLNFFLEMMLNPCIQAKAQQEIDSVIGAERLPTISDKESLPYVRSIVTEVFRLNPAVPLGIAHALTADDKYEGMDLPQGSIVIPNVWHMLHDPDVFPNPMQFDPDRYGNLDTEMQKVTDLVFGFGRRLCPGKTFGENNVFAVAATVLATCKVVLPVDEHGAQMRPDVQYSSGSISSPSSFQCDIKPRSVQAYQLLLSSVSNISETLSPE
ncbi:putative monooxygenase [Favolaschia claudopus]|uniref:Monooxygenase n=1 Tax=Favolaschia claudopus TaxID=2862362 RepID=A0AAW0DFV1_9AGAR